MEHYVAQQLLVWYARISYQGIILVARSYEANTRSSVVVHTSQSLNMKLHWYYTLCGDYTHEPSRETSALLKFT